MGMEQYSKAVQETARKLRGIDDALFRLLAEKKGVCQEILRVCLDMPKLKVEHVTAQSVVKSLHREITLDVHCVLENGEHVNIEVQKGTDHDDILRTRFHAAALTAAYTPKGTDFAEVPPVTILYITEYDALHNGQTISRVLRCMETPEGFRPVRDREEIYFANTAVDDGSEKSQFLQLLLRQDAFEDERYPQLCEAVRYFKETKGGRSEVCKAVENLARDYAKEYWREGRGELISYMILSGKTAAEIVELTGAPLAEVVAVAESMPKK